MEQLSPGAPLWVCLCPLASCANCAKYTCLCLCICICVCLCLGLSLGLCLCLCLSLCLGLSLSNGAIVPSAPMWVCLCPLASCANRWTPAWHQTYLGLELSPDVPFYNHLDSSDHDVEDELHFLLMSFLFSKCHLLSTVCRQFSSPESHRSVWNILLSLISFVLLFRIQISHLHLLSSHELDFSCLKYYFA